MSTYIILDATHADYRNTVSRLVSISASTFDPRLSLDRTKALIQIKDAVRFNRVDFGSKLGTLLLGTGDEDWARTQVADSAWRKDTVD